MKSLSLLNDDTTIKLGDTGTMVQFTATNNEAPVQLNENQTATFRIKNDFGLVKTINATTTYNGLIFQFDTADLSGLVQGKYQVELAVNVDKDNTLIFPDDGFVSFTLSANALNIVGQQLNLISLDDFKEQANQYIQQQAQDLESNFDSYVAKIKQGPKGDKGDVGEQGIQGPKGDNGENATLSLGNNNIYKPWVLFDSWNQSYKQEWINGSGVSSSSNSDVATDYFECPANCTIAINTPSLDLTRFVTTNGGPLRISFYDQNKTHISQVNFGKNYPTPGQVTTVSPKGTYFARISFNCCDSTTANGNNLRIQCISIGFNTIDMTTQGSTNTLDLNFSASLPGIQGSQGPQGEMGPQGTIGNYVTGTGWLDLNPYLNKDVLCGWDSNGTSNLGWNRYAVTVINGQPIFWFRIHTRVKDATVLQSFGTKLFDIPADVTNQYGQGEWNQYNQLLECCSIPFLPSVNFNSDNKTRQVVTNGYVPFYKGGNQVSLPTGTQTINYEGWFIL